MELNLDARNAVGASGDVPGAGTGDSERSRTQEAPRCPRLRGHKEPRASQFPRPQQVPRPKQLSRPERSLKDLVKLELEETLPPSAPSSEQYPEN